MIRHRFGRSIRALLAFSMVGAVLTPAAVVRADFQTPPVGDLQLFPEAKFDWEMPPRTGLDENHDGVIDSRTTRAAVGAPAGGWAVHFDACASTPSTGAVIGDYRWYVDGYPVTNPDVQNGACGGFQYSFPSEGKYTVTLVVTNAVGGEMRMDDVTEEIVVQDFLIVALGDSFGSGQGNPDIPMEGAELDSVWTAWGRVAARSAELIQLQDDFADTDAGVELAFDAYRDLLTALRNQAMVCDPFGGFFDAGACVGSALTAVAGATNALTTALRVLGMEFQMDLLGSVEGFLDGLRATAWEVVQAAEESWLGAVDLFETATAEASPTWQDRRCNRSSISGQAMAALALEEADPHTSVTFVHLSCSGAEVPVGLLGSYAGVEPPDGASPLPPQVDKARSLVGDREVDAVLLSIGGNDVGFGPVVEACIFQDSCHDAKEPEIDAVDTLLCNFSERYLAVFLLSDQTCGGYFQGLYNDYITDKAPAGEIFGAKSTLLPGNYTTLATRLGEAFPAVGADPGRVLITEYPNAVQDASRNLCVSTDTNLETMLPGITLQESAWLRDTVTTGLNGMVAKAASDHGWTLVDGIYSAFATHGYCSSSEWFRRMPDSFVMQGTMMGAVHPNEDGHQLIGERVFATLQAALYPDGGGGGGTPTFTLPRLPNLSLRPVVSPGDTTPPEVVGFPDRSPNGAGWYSAPVVVNWQATDNSGVAEDPADTLAEVQGEHTYVSDPSCDLAGNCATGQITLMIDTGVPHVTGRAFGLVDGIRTEVKPNERGWFNSDVTIEWTAADPVSGLVPGTVLGPSEVSGDGLSVTYKSPETCDRAGNCGSGTFTLSIDRTPPVVVCPATPVFQVGGSGMVSARVWDWLSKPEAKEVSAAADTTTAGAKLVSLTGWDRAGNSTTAACGYIVAYDFGAGFGAPIDGDGVLNVVKAGRAIPLKWRLTDALGAPVLGLSTATITVSSLTCSLATSTDNVETTTAGGSGLQNLGDGWYQLNWKSPNSYAGSCKTLSLNLGEGLVHTALFKFTK